MASETGYVSSNGIRLYYEVAGDGPTLVLIHAGIADSRMWDDQWEAFSREFRTIRYDVRGYGKSANPDGEFGHDEDLDALLQHLGVEQASFVAVSMAGQIALNYLLGHPEKANALVLVGSGVDTIEPSEALIEGWRAVGKAFDAGDIAGANEIEMQLWVDGPSRTPDQIDARVRERAAAMNLLALQQTNEAAQERPIDPPIAQRLHEIAVPTLIVVGDLDQPVVVESADIYAREIPGARKVVMHGVAHLPNMEQPTEFNQIVLDFLHNIHNSSTSA